MKEESAREPSRGGYIMTGPSTCNTPQIGDTLSRAKVLLEWSRRERVAGHYHAADWLRRQAIVADSPELWDALRAWRSLSSPNIKSLLEATKRHRLIISQLEDEADGLMRMW